MVAFSGNDLEKWFKRNERLRKRVQYLADRDIYLRDQLKSMRDNHKKLSEAFHDEMKATSDLRSKVHHLETRLWQLENPPKHSVSDIVYPIIEDKTRTDIPLLIISIEYKGFSSELLSRIYGPGFINETHSHIPNHWQYRCFDENKKEESIYKEDEIGTCEKSKP